MVAVLVDSSPTTFTLNGIPYFKNFLPVPSGNKIRIVNTYDSRLEILPLSDYTDFTIDGGSFGSVAALQAALLPVLFTRTSLAGITVAGEITNVVLSAGNVLTFTLADTSTVEIDLSALDQAQGLADHIADTGNPHNVTKAQVGLGNVDNTADAYKPISTLQQTALDGKQDKGYSFTNVSAPGDKTGLWVFGYGVAGINSGGYFQGRSNNANPSLDAHLDNGTKIYL